MLEVVGDDADEADGQGYWRVPVFVYYGFVVGFVQFIQEAGGFFVDGVEVP